MTAGGMVMVILNAIADALSVKQRYALETRKKDFLAFPDHELDRAGRYKPSL